MEAPTSLWGNFQDQEGTSQTSVTPPTTVEQTPTVNNVPSQAIVPCPTIQYILGTCGTRSPTLPPETRAPVVNVPLESVCTVEKFQVRNYFLHWILKFIFLSRLIALILTFHYFYNPKE